ncbi:MAG: hypothetical protein Q4C58_14895 [Eubacteriales bacterium]|nr:hypothetical protein [Eubacteriales bacterium]
MNRQQDDIQWSKSNHSIFEDFALDLQAFDRTKKPPFYGGQDLNYCLELQQKRLQDKKLVMKYEFVPRGHFADKSGPGKSWRDDHYLSRMEYRTCRLNRTFYREGRKVYEKARNFIFYQIVTFIHNRDAVAADLYTCPACGAISRIADLQQGCPYCGTFFEMNDLFPKVTNFFFVRDSGGTEKELKSEIGKWIRPCIGLSAVGYILYFLLEGGGILQALISGTLGGIVFGAIIGYLLWVVRTLGSLFKEAGKSLPMLTNVAGSEKRFVSLMKRYSPEFSYEYFSDKAVSLLKMIIFSGDARELPNYAGEPVGNLFSDIVESAYTGAVALKQFQVRGDDCLVAVDVYMENIYDDGGRIYSQNDKFRVYLKKNIRKPIDYHFSIRRILCKGCGGSFDATKQRSCPNCQKKYELEDDDWCVVKIQKR